MTLGSFDASFAAWMRRVCRHHAEPRCFRQYLLSNEDSSLAAHMQITWAYKPHAGGSVCGTCGKAHGNDPLLLFCYRTNCMYVTDKCNIGSTRVLSTVRLYISKPGLGNAVPCFFWELAKKGWFLYC